MERDDKHHWLKWYPKDFATDEDLRRCSRAARSFWHDLLWLMLKSEKRGYLVFNGHPATDKDLADTLGDDPRSIRSWLRELGEKGVFSTSDEGEIYSRRLVRDHEKALKNKANGALGGNKALSKTVNPPLKAIKQVSNKSINQVTPIGGKRPPSKRKPMMTMPEEFSLTPAMRKVAIEIGLPDARVELCFFEFKRYFTLGKGANDTRPVDHGWENAFEDWVRKELEWSKGRAPGKSSTKITINGRKVPYGYDIPHRHRDRDDQWQDGIPKEIKFVDEDGNVFWDPNPHYRHDAKT